MNVKALLSRVPVTAYIISGAMVVLWGAWVANGYHQREVGRRDVLIAQAERANADLRRQADSLARAYHVDTVRLTQIRRVVDSLTTTVEVWKRDTLRVVEYVEKADSTIRVCAQALATCEARVLVAQRGWDGARVEIALLKKSFPSKATPLVWGIAGAGVGWVARTLLK